MENKEFDAWLVAMIGCRKAWSDLTPDLKERAMHFEMRVYLPSGETKLPMLSIVSTDISPNGEFDQYLEDIACEALGLFDAEFDEDPDCPEVIRLRNEDAVKKAIANGIFPFIEDGLMYMAIDEAFVV